VLATIALEGAIIAPQLFTALVITAIVTSQFAGWWLDRALRDRGELLGEQIRVPEGAMGSGTPTSAPLEPA
jgi:hypothetical protein